MTEEMLAEAAREVTARLVAGDSLLSIAESIYEGPAQRRRFSVIRALARGGVPLGRAIEIVNAVDPEHPESGIYT